MKRTLLALAIASSSLSALAGPPTDKPPVGPVDVNVVNTPANPVPVVVTPGMLPTLGIVKTGSAIFLEDSDGLSGYDETCFAIDAPMRITQLGLTATGVAQFSIVWRLAVRPIGGTEANDIRIAFGQMDGKPIGVKYTASMTLPMNVVTPGYDKLCVGAMSDTSQGSTLLEFSAVGEVL